jgi:non-specific serine/threonine protein kinase
MAEERPPHSNTTSAAVALWIDRAVDRFEADWQSSQGDARPQIEDYLAGCSGSQQRCLFRELLYVELEIRASRGEQPNPDEYFNRFPHERTVISQVFGASTPPRPVVAPDSLAPTVARQTIRRTAAHGRDGLSVSPGEVVPPLDRGGSRIGNYGIVREIGRGGMGVVYQAYDPFLDRYVAIKVLSQDLRTEPAAIERFLIEARATAALDDQNVATIFEIGQTHDGHPFIVMAYYEGETLQERLARGPLRVAEALEIAIEIARGLQAAHRTGVVHRDIKPSNIILTREGVVKIVDFGLARTARWHDTQEEKFQGTVAYMSPEQIRCDAVDSRTDMWSLGVVLYEILTGQNPFRREDSQRTVDAILYAAPVPLSHYTPNVPRLVEGVVCRLLDKDADRRFAMSSELLIQLEAAAVDAGFSFAKPKRSPGDETLPKNLPLMLTSFVGRDRETHDLIALIRSGRLITLTGTAGTGKTRLAVHVAAQVEGEFRDGVCFVPLASICDANLVESTLAQAMGVPDTGAVLLAERLAHFLKDKHGLVVLDNFEHVLDAAGLLSELLKAGPRIKLLVTSRAALHLQGEQEYGVPPLALPPAGGSLSAESLSGFESVSLFVQRARAVHSGFSLTEENAEIVREICIRLDGLPLAIELAAAQAKALSPRAILARLTSRLDAPSAGPFDAPARHQSLRAAIGWSHDLLRENEKDLFRRLSVFIGGHRVEAAEAVVSAVTKRSTDVLAGHLSLVDKSLLAQVDEPDGEPRFYMLETVREFSREALLASGEERLARRAHSEFFLRLAEQSEAHLTGPEQELWLVALERDLENLRAALEWTIVNELDGTRAARLAAALWRFWLIRGLLSEGRSVLHRILDSHDRPLPEELQAKLLAADGTLAHNQGDYAAASSAYEGCLKLHRQMVDHEGEAATLNNLSWIGWRQGNYAAAASLAEQALQLHRRLENQRGIFWAINNLGWVAQYRGEFNLAVNRFEECLQLEERLHSNRDRGFTLTNLGWAVSSRGEISQGIVLLKKAVSLLTEVGDRQLTAFASARLGAVIHEHGDSHTAERLLQEGSLPTFRTIGDQWGIAFTLTCLGLLHQDLGDDQRALQLFEEGLALRRKTGDKWGIADSLARLAAVALCRHEVESAERYLVESLRIREELPDKDGIACCLEGLALVAGHAGQPSRGVRLHGAAARLREVIHAPLRRRSREFFDTWLVLQQEALGNHSFASAMEEGCDMNIAEAIAYARARQHRATEMPS